MTKIDELDRRIIELLQSDGMLKNVVIAEQLSTSEATVRRRRARLQANDVIRVVAVADPFKLGFNIMAIIGVRIEQGYLKDVEKALNSMPEVRFLGVVLGAYDIMLEAWFKSSDEFLNFVTVTLAEIKGITRTESFQVMRLSKYTYDWGKPTSLGRAEPVSE